MSGIVNSAGSKSGVIGNVQLEDPAVTGWYCTLGSTVDMTSVAVLDFTTVHSMGSSNSESGGTITIGTAGWYFITATVSNNASDLDYMEFYFYLNGSNTLIRGYQSSQSQDYQQWTTFVHVELSATDTIAWRGQGHIYGATGSGNSMTCHAGFRTGK